MARAMSTRAAVKDEQYRWFAIRYKPGSDDHGNIIRWYARN